MPLEQLIQPLANPLNLDRIIASKNKQTVEPAILRWGTIGKLPSPVQEATPQVGVNFTVKDETKYNENKRDTENVTVQNPNDSSQSVDVQRVKSITFDGPPAQNKTSNSTTGYPVPSGSSPSSTDGFVANQFTPPVPKGPGTSQTVTQTESGYYAYGPLKPTQSTFNLKYPDSSS